MTHEISKYCLGSNWEQALEEIIQSKVDQIGIEFYADKKTGEIDLAALRKFQSLENELHAACREKVQAYFRAVTVFRKSYNLTPFNPARETRDRIKTAIDGKYFKKPSFRVVKMPEAKKAKSTDDMSTRELSETMKIKPEYQGANHPLEVNQIIRNPNPRPVPHSRKAIKALEEFEARTGKKGFIRYPTKVTPIK